MDGIELAKLNEYYKRKEETMNHSDLILASCHVDVEREHYVDLDTGEIIDVLPPSDPEQGADPDHILAGVARKIRAIDGEIERLGNYYTHVADALQEKIDKTNAVIQTAKDRRAALTGFADMVMNGSNIKTRPLPGLGTFRRRTSTRVDRTEYDGMDDNIKDGLANTYQGCFTEKIVKRPDAASIKKLILDDGLNIPGFEVETTTSTTFKGE